MKRLLILSAIITAMLMVLSSSWASISLNSSRSNIYRLVYPADLVSQAQASALLAELDKLGPADEATLNRWLRANFKRFGIQENRVKRISIYLEQQISCTASVGTCKGKWVDPGLNARKEANAVCFCYGPITSPTQVRQVDKASPIRILLLTDPADEAAAMAIKGTGVPKNNQ
jgi:hypothetical protein